MNSKMTKIVMLIVACLVSGISASAFTSNRLTSMYEERVSTLKKMLLEAQEGLISRGMIIVKFQQRIEYSADIIEAYKKQVNLFPELVKNIRFDDNNNIVYYKNPIGDEQFWEYDDENKLVHYVCPEGAAWWQTFHICNFEGKKNIDYKEPEI